MRNKLEREVSLQKPKLEVLTNKREELEKRLSACSTKETELHSNCQELMAGIDNEEFKQILQDAMRMKQLEVLIFVPFFFRIDANRLFFHNRRFFKELRIRILISQNVFNPELKKVLKRRICWYSLRRQPNHCILPCERSLRSLHTWKMISM